MFTKLAMPLERVTVVMMSKEEYQLMFQLETILVKLFDKIPDLTDKETKARRS